MSGRETKKCHLCGKRLDPTAEDWTVCDDCDHVFCSDCVWWEDDDVGWICGGCEAEKERKTKGEESEVKP